MKDDWKNDFQSSFFMLIIIINDYPQNYPYKMKAVITTDSISLRSRKMLLTFECPQDILINRSRPVHEATGGHAVRGNYCIHNHV